MNCQHPRRPAIETKLLGEVLENQYIGTGLQVNPMLLKTSILWWHKKVGDVQSLESQFRRNRASHVDNVTKSGVMDTGNGFMVLTTR